jgi:hypothetical protein
MANSYAGGRSVIDIETTGLATYDLNDTSHSSFVYNVQTDERYTGLNRAQRRKAMAVENRAWRKQAKASRRG